MSAEGSCGFAMPGVGFKNPHTSASSAVRPTRPVCFLRAEDKGVEHRVEMLWRQKSLARSQLKLAIEDLLDTGLPRACTPEFFQQKCEAVFEHVYESYPERDAGVYSTAG